jgi:phosphoribosylformylglycinamidine cyclo-ligase
LSFFNEIPDIGFGFSIDGIGTKMDIALKVGKLDTIGKCLVHHCVNDLLTAGVRARVFLDYVATSKLKAKQAAEIVKGVAEACKELGIVLAGGELAEMPGYYPGGKYELAGSIMGMVKKEEIIDGSKIESGDRLVALPSAGIHCNGFSLVRKIIKECALDLNEKMPRLGKTLAEELLEPTKCYAPLVFEAIDKGIIIKGIANITGGGIPGNLIRILPEDCGAVIDFEKIKIWMPEIFKLIQSKGRVPWPEMVRTFNLGVGMILVLSPEEFDRIGNYIPDAFEIGEIVKGERKVELPGIDLKTIDNF